MSPGRRELLVLGAAGLAAAAAGFFAGPALLRLGQGGDEKAAKGALPAASFPDLAGKPRQLNEWQGRVVVCNFWATWCAPCREEIPLLNRFRGLHLASGVEILGIAIDNAAKVIEFTRSVSISYPVLIAEGNGLEFMRQLGNASGGLPYTVFFDRAGQVAHRKLGAIKEPELQEVLGRLARS